MIGKVAGLLSCTLGVSAFLLPPNVNRADSKFAVAPFTNDASLFNHVIAVPCSSCAFPYTDYKTESEDDLFFAQGSANLLAFNFTITSDRPTELQLNHHTIYPFDIFTELENLSSDWTVEQIPASVTEEELVSGAYTRSSLKITGAGIGIGPIKTFTQEDEELISIRWQLLSLEDNMIDLDALYIQLIKQTNGELILLSVDFAPRHVLDEVAFPMPEPTMDVRPPHSDCGFLPQALCSLGHRIAGKLNGMKHGKPTCGKPAHPHGPEGKLPSHIKTHFDSFDDKMEEGHKRPHHGWPHDHHHHRHGIFHAVSKAILAILIPVMAGITVGMTVSILGLLFGRFIGWLWFTVIPGRQRGYIRVDEETFDEKDIEATEEVDALPLYEEAPAYEEVPKDTK